MKNLLACKKLPDIIYQPVYDSPNIIDIEAVNTIQTLCPVQASTGLPLSFVQAVLTIDPQKSRLASALVQQLPTVQAMNVSDDDKFRLMISRLDSGSFAENDNVSEILGNLVKEFLPNVSDEEFQTVVDSVDNSVSPDVTVTE